MMAIENCDSFRATREGFCLYRDGDECHYRDDDVVGIKVNTRRQLDAIGRTEIVKSLQIRFDTNDEALVENELGPQGQDVLETLEQRVVDQLYQRAIKDLDHGLDVQGENWRVSLVEFVHETTHHKCSIQQISKVKWDGDDLCIWHEDHLLEPFARVDRGAENATLLYRILRTLVDVVDADIPTGAQVGMGPRLGEYSTHHGPTISHRNLAIATGLAMTTILATLPLNLAAIGVLILLMIALIVVPHTKGTDETLRIYEKGLIWSSGHDEQVLLLEQIASFSFYHAGMTGIPREFDGVVHIKPKDTEMMDIEMDVKGAITNGTFRAPLDRMVQSLKARMDHELCQHGYVNWLPGVNIERTGLRLTFAHESTFVRFVEIHACERAGDQLKLLDKNQHVLLQTETWRPNFFPGWRMIEELRSLEDDHQHLSPPMKSIS